MAIVNEDRMLLEDRRKLVDVLKAAIAGLEEQENFPLIAEQVARLRLTLAEQEQIIEHQGANILRDLRPSL